MYLCIYFLLNLNGSHTIHLLLFIMSLKKFQFILMLLILTLNKIHSLFSVINVDFEHDIFLSEVEKFPSRLLKRVFVREI